MKTVITGGAGFIGSNAAARFLRRGDSVVIVDNLSRRGTALNLKWLESLGGNLELVRVNIADAPETLKAFEKHADCNLVLHLAGQVAVTSSVKDPRDDFMSNALGTFNVLEGMRLNNIQAPIIYSSTNKVYGGMEDLGVELKGGRWAYANCPSGVEETYPLDFHSPYGCSKGAADQYVRDYARIFGLKTVVMRQSCIYGYRQFGLEDQGWVAWFTIATQLGQPISIFGDGRQVRDILFVEDVIDAYEAAAKNIDRCSGEVFNVGGGSGNIISLLDLIEFLSQKSGRPIPFRQDDWRPGDQKCFVSNNDKAARIIGWRPKHSAKEGLEKLWNWVAENKALFQ